MLNNFKHKNNLFCFTPGAMLATFIVEIILAIYAFLRYRVSLFGQLISATLFLLAIFQIAEYQICTGMQQIIWIRIGFIAVTLLPILGLHLVFLINNKKGIEFLKLGYAVSFIFILFFVFPTKAINGAVCAGNYIIFNISQKLVWLYSFYYFGFLFLGLYEALNRIFFIKKEATKKRALIWMIVGYLSFMLPTGIVYIVYEATRTALTSVMCGFAIIFALILVFKIAPKYYSVEANS